MTRCSTTSTSFAGKVSSLSDLVSENLDDFA
jgi:hypothetical protein